MEKPMIVRMAATMVALNCRPSRTAPSGNNNQSSSGRREESPARADGKGNSYRTARKTGCISGKQTRRDCRLLDFRADGGANMLRLLLLKLRSGKSFTSAPTTFAPVSAAA